MSSIFGSDILLYLNAWTLYLSSARFWVFGISVSFVALVIIKIYARLRWEIPGVRLSKEFMIIFSFERDEWIFNWVCPLFDSLPCNFLSYSFVLSILHGTWKRRSAFLIQFVGKGKCNLIGTWSAAVVSYDTLAEKKEDEENSPHTRPIKYYPVLYP